jgi:hypothetical protein
MCEACEEDEAFFMAYYAKARAQLPKTVAPRGFSAEGFAAQAASAPSTENRFACDEPIPTDQRRR